MTNVSLVGFGRIGRDLFRQTLGDKEIIFNSWKNGDEADWVKIGTDVVILATGKPKTKKEVDVHLSKGCKKVIVASTPENFKDIQIFVPGANDENIDFKSNVFSLGSNLSLIHISEPTRRS